MIMYLKTSSCVVYFKITLKKMTVSCISYRGAGYVYCVEGFMGSCSSSNISAVGFGWKVKRVYGNVLESVIKFRKFL